MKTEIKIMVGMAAAATLLLSAYGVSNAEIGMADRYRGTQITAADVVLVGVNGELSFATTVGDRESLVFTESISYTMLRYPKFISLKWPTPIALRSPKFISLRWPTPIALRSPKFISLRWPTPIALRSPKFISLRWPTPIALRSPMFTSLP